MKIRWTRRTVRVRLDDLEMAALALGETLRETLDFPGGAWSLELGAAQEPEFGMKDGVLCIMLDPRELEHLNDRANEGVQREGQPRLLVEKDRLTEGP